MRYRKKVIFVLIQACIVYLVIYMMLQWYDPFNKSDTTTRDLQLETRLQQLEHNLKKHGEEVVHIQRAMVELLPHEKPLQSKRSSNVMPEEAERNGNSCSFQVSYPPRTDVQMLELYKELEFLNLDGGVWKQGWKIEVNPMEWNQKHKLKVFVVPHSHNDPGWTKTVEEYYLSQTKHILSNMLVKLQEDVRRKFIWAEVSYFSMWWDELDPAEREIVKLLVRNEQLEIVTGGWVMNDEANTHWTSVMLQLIEGHQWLHRNLNYTPVSHWAIDPFGLSPTQALLLKKMELSHMLIQRVHYSVKKHLAKEKMLEFRWRQNWDNDGRTDMFTQVMPFYAYDIPHTCGPDPKICCQFDFKRLPGHGVHCPWKIPPQAIDEENVAHKAELLLDQYRKKSKLFKTNVLFVPLGDDFRYDHISEWNVQLQNYEKLFEFMNWNEKMNVQIQWGTLTDYFRAVAAEKKPEEFPTLGGDFFTYADRDDHYWSGYYTSRPFYKRMERVVLSYARAAEIALTLLHLSGNPGRDVIKNDGKIADRMQGARRALALFQHHDGITGTAKDHVVVDYAKKLLSAIKHFQYVIQLCTKLLLEPADVNIDIDEQLFYNVDDVRNSHDSLEERHTITIGPELSTKHVTIFNTLTFTRHEVVSFVVSTPYIEVWNWQNQSVECQISPVFEYGATMSLLKYKLSFIANVPPLALITYVVRAVTEKERPRRTTYASVKIFNRYGEVKIPRGFTDVQISPVANAFKVHNSRVTAAFNSLGLLKAVKIGRDIIPARLEFVKYNARRTREMSGAYLFLPDGDAVPLKIDNPVVKVIEGPIVSSVNVHLPYVQHTLTLYNSSGADGLGLEVRNVVDIAQTSNFELAMRLSTNINNADTYFTDSNGFQILKRERLKKLPVQALFYPVPTMAYIEDDNVRVSLLTSSPLGGSSLKDGQLTLMMDRRLDQDDNLGLGQPVHDNRPTRHVIRLLFEKRIATTCQDPVENHPAGFATVAAHLASQTLLNPLFDLLKVDDDATTRITSYMPSSSEFGVDFTLPSLRTGILLNGNEYVGLVLHRQHLNTCFADKESLSRGNGKVNFSELLPVPSRRTKYNLHKSSLSFLRLKGSVDFYGDVHLCPMEVQAFLLH